ncbi:MAG: hypothetical protein AB8B69_21310 [Chitinophagales bacterium]
MKRHNGMRPQDIVILLKIIAQGGKRVRLTSMANDLYISLSEVSEGLHRCKFAKLVDEHKKLVNRAALFEFLVHGIKYVFPLEAGRLVYGLKTAHSTESLQSLFPNSDEDVFVWEMKGGTVKGQALTPLHKNVALAAKDDPKLHELLALVDIIRLGIAEESTIAVEKLKELMEL